MRDIFLDAKLVHRAVSPRTCASKRHLSALPPIQTARWPLGHLVGGPIGRWLACPGRFKRRYTSSTQACDSADGELGIHLSTGQQVRALCVHAQVNTDANCSSLHTHVAELESV